MSILLYDKIGSALQKKGNTLAIAESVTAGSIQAAISLARDAGQFFQGGITAYNLGQKTRHLMIEPIEAENCNSVSQKVANTMAVNVCKMFLSDYGLGITGYANPVPEKNILSVFAFVSIAKGNKILLTQKIRTNQQRQEAVREYYTNKALQLLLSVL
jgi:PncC family amidohydrolase